MERCASCNASLDGDSYFSGSGEEICSGCYMEGSYDTSLDEPELVRGSFGLGFAAGLLGGCIGAILVLLLAKGEETKRGARAGFILQFVLGALLRLLAAA